jgi:hypothetical protein
MPIPIQVRHPEFATNSLFETMRLQIVALQAHLTHRVTTAAPALVIGTASNLDIRVNVAIDYIRDAVRRAQLAVGELDVPAAATMASEAVARQVVVLVFINAADAYAAIVSPIARGGALAVVPRLPVGCVQLGFVRIAVTANNVYTANTTALNAAALTVTYVNSTVAEQNWLVPMRVGTI